MLLSRSPLPKVFYYCIGTTQEPTMKMGKKIKGANVRDVKLFVVTFSYDHSGAATVIVSLMTVYKIVKVGLERWRHVLFRFLGYGWKSECKYTLLLWMNNKYIAIFCKKVKVCCIYWLDIASNKSLFYVAFIG